MPKLVIAFLYRLDLAMTAAAVFLACFYGLMGDAWQSSVLCAIAAVLTATAARYAKKELQK